MSKRNLNDIFEHIKRGFFSGIGWAIGTTVGFALIFAILLNISKGAGGLPIVGGFIATIVESTQQALSSKTR